MTETLSPAEVLCYICEKKHESGVEVCAACWWDGGHPDLAKDLPTRHTEELSTLRQRAERAEAERDAAKELAESRWVELEALLGEWNLCVKLSGSPTHGGLAGHVGRLRTQAAQTDAAQSTIAELTATVERLTDLARHLRGCVTCGEHDVEYCTDGDDLWRAALPPETP